MPANHYLQNGDQQLKTEIKRIEKLAEPNKGYALEYKAWMERQARNKRTIAKRLDELIFILKWFDKKDAKKTTKADIQALISAINNAKRKNGIPIATISKGKIKLTLRKFYKFLYNSKNYPELVEDVKPDRAKNSLLPTDMITESQVEDMLAGCRNSRDRAIISLLFSGLRVGELLNLHIQDVKIEDDGYSVIVNGKSGQRSVFLMNHKYLQEFIRDMRSKATPDAWLFVRLVNGVPTEELLSYDALKKQLYDLRARTPSMVGHKCNPHTWRHSYASFLAQQNINPEIMRRLFGWASNEQAMCYVHINDQAVKSALLKLGNKKVIVPEPKLVPKICWRCEYEMTPDRKICPQCAADLENPVAKHDKIEQEKKEYATMKAKMEQVEAISGKMLQFMQVVKKKNPKLFAEFENIVADG